ncbi:MAG: tRNA (adenosine(37)-N6)-dimethylallyltransferase MiaA [Chlamydiae bacterium]|nr:tRNA (adenosine(37)-N6)-dimethylallyltransferase MiaA [Chlamydiota bacterium]
MRPQTKKVPCQASFAKPKVIILAGPTAVGKTALSLILAGLLSKVEIISADSMQVYRGMDIGTAKASWKERLAVPHHLIDVREINDPYNVVDFFYDCQSRIADILKRNKIPIISGGSGFYLHSLLNGPPSGPPSVPLLRKKLEDECEELGIEHLFKRLKKLDTLYASTISTKDKQKIIRALEIISLTKQPVSAFKPPIPPSYDWRCWFLSRERKGLYERIEKRCDEMIAEGLLDEVTRLKREGILMNKSAMQSIGYRQSLNFLDSTQTLTDFASYKEDLKKCSRHLAKRQFTWFRTEPAYSWLELDTYDMEAVALQIIQDYGPVQ